MKPLGPIKSSYPLIVSLIAISDILLLLVSIQFGIYSPNCSPYYSLYMAFDNYLNLFNIINILIDSKLTDDRQKLIARYVL